MAAMKVYSTVVMLVALMDEKQAAVKVDGKVEKLVLPKVEQ
jgi:hypothetical protein